MIRARCFASLCAIALVAQVAPAFAQLPDCTGHDAGGASTEFEAGNALMTQAIDQAGHRHMDRARELATEALARFDRQCELGDTSAFAERGAALLLLGEPLRSAQSYDAYLVLHPLDTIDARTRRRIEPNLQPGTLVLEVESPRGQLFVNDLDFGGLPETRELRLPYGELRVEVRDEHGAVLVFQDVSLTQEASRVELHLTVPPIEAEVTEPEVTAPVVTPPTPPTPPPPPPPERTDFVPFYIASAAVAGVGLALGIGMLIGADERARTYNAGCYPVIVAGCSDYLSERDTYIGVGIAGFVLGGLGVAGLITTWILDSSQPRERVRLSFGPTGASVAGTF